MKILRLEYEWGNDVYCVKGTPLGIEWWDAVDVIRFLTSKGTIIECKTVERCTLGEKEYQAFMNLWEDIGNSLEEDFETLFAIANNL